MTKKAGIGKIDKEDQIESSSEEKSRLDKIEREKEDLLKSMLGGNFSSMRTRVAYVLNLFPQARNSDITLAIKYWELFQPEIYNKSGILPEDLFRLERLHYIVRARAKIQNTYGLFTSDSEIRRYRKKREEEMRDEILEDAQPQKIVAVFADETGKNQEHIIVASVWVLTGKAVFTITQAIKNWQKESPWKSREIHFAKLGRKDAETLAEYLDIIQKNREFLSFKAIAVKKDQTRRKIEEVIEKLHEHMLINGIEHEIKTNRITLPQTMNVTVDADQSLDAFTLSEIKRRISSQLKTQFNNEIRLYELGSISSRKSPLVQLSDIIAGAINRKLNHSGSMNFKDEMANKIIDSLDLQLSEENLRDIDVTAWFKV